MRQTRRTLLAFAPSLPLALAAPAMGAPADPDAALLDMLRQHSEKEAAYDALEAVVEAALNRAVASTPSLPAVLKQRADDWFTYASTGAPLPRKSVEKWRETLASGAYRQSLCAASAARLEARGVAIIAAWDAHQAEVETAKVATGYRALSAEQDRISGELYRLERLIIATPASGVAAWRGKAAIAAKVLGPGDGTYEDFVVRNLIADLLGDDAPTGLRIVEEG